MKAESSYFSDFIMRVRLRARVRAKTIFFWKFFDFGIFSEFPAFKVKLARACARAGAHMKKFEKYELSAFTGKKIINFKWFLMILDYFENSWNDHEFLETSNVIFMHILLTFWVNMSFLETSSKKMWIYKFRLFLKSRVLNPNLIIFFLVKAESSYF